MKVSILYGKETLSTAGKKGYVLSVNVSGGKIVSYTCADENEKRFTIDADSVKSVKEKIVYVDGGKGAAGAPLRLGKPVFDCEGAYLGRLTDFTAEKNVLLFAHSGAKKFSADDIVCGDAVIVKSSARVLKSDVKKNGRINIRKGTPLTPETLEKAEKHGEYVQANLKTF